MAAELQTQGPTAQKVAGAVIVHAYNFLLMTSVPRKKTDATRTAQDHFWLCFWLMPTDETVMAAVAACCTTLPLSHPGSGRDTEHDQRSQDHASLRTQRTCCTLIRRPRFIQHYRESRIADLDPPGMRLSSPLAAGGARRRYRRSTFGSLVALLGVAGAVLCAVVDAASVSEKDGGVHVCADFPGRIVAVKGFATRRIAFGRLRSFGVQTVITDGAASEPYGADATAEPHLSTARVVEDPVLRPYPESVQQRSAPQSLMPALRPSIEVTAATVRAAAAAAGADTNPAATAATTPPDTRLLGSSASIGSVAESNDSAVAAPDPDNRDEPPSGSSAMDAEDVDGEDAIMADADSDAEPAFDDMTLLSMAEQSRKVFTNTTFIIVRHGEKLTWPDGKAPSRGAKKRYVDDTLLSAKGHERAFALVGYFLHRKEMTDLLKDRPLTTIIAQASDPRPNAAGKSQRPYQTIAPLLAALTAAAQTLPVSPAPFGHASAATVTGVLRADGTVDHGDPVDVATAAERAKERWPRLRLLHQGSKGGRRLHHPVERGFVLGASKKLDTLAPFGSGACAGGTYDGSAILTWPP
ncbi:hypothetical protein CAUPRSCDRAFT_11760 [Caulochytrium protostelioides]|uniref:Uncharacterized protein n=1 Tax=Caulochytrium protostelioides TaxID=1555241 RepID=A0A4V1ITC2_9FUNG|nr:hypothetical protein CAUPRSCDRAFT_11760 [Caulochytrium protostelioides]